MPEAEARGGPRRGGARWARIGLWILALAALALLAASTLGTLHPGGNTLAVVRWQTAAGLALLAALLTALGARRGAWLLLPAGLALAQAGWAWFQPQATPARPVVLYQKNLSFRLVDPAALLADIRAAAPDVVTLQEVSDPDHAVLAGLQLQLPTQHWCPFSWVGGVALATRFPEVPGGRLCIEALGIAALKAETPAGPLWLVSVHLHWPWPFSDEQVSRLLPVLARLDAPALIGGDFNMVPWAGSQRQIASASGTRRVGRAHNTFPRFGPLLPLPIDLIYAPEGATGAVEPRPLLGSDHRGLLARIAL